MKRPSPKQRDSAPDPEDEDLRGEGEEDLDPEDLLDAADLDDLDEEEGDDGDEDAEGGEDDEEAPARRKKKASDEDEPPGPDVPAPPTKKLRAALEWAFQNEDVSGELLDRFAEHAHLMLEANRKVNLTAILDPKEVAAKHYLDSWRVTQMMSLVGRTVVDLGCGPGFPGLPIAMAEMHTKVTLIDSTKKKVDFVADCIEQLGIKNAAAHWGRAEEWLATNRCDVVVMRAISSVRENVRTLRKVRHSLKDLVMLKGASWSREVRAGEREAERLGFTLDTVLEHELPEELGKRAILIYRAPGGQGL
ncbi:MAG: 16S rRNA (guanine(527)-N(7))-methyltransferase RsmG [Planctomycetes bacterium]|nr:16S rRNA (guanine(527)-N(7))-methyltransferase RsmG [Planctomycetota bacterium]